MGNGEAKELMCMPHGHELSGEIAGGKEDTRWKRTKGRKQEMGHCNSIINKIYLI